VSRGAATHEVGDGEVDIIKRNEDDERGEEEDDTWGPLEG
jgi:hypothetical protein